jgi:ABC-type transport system substrate-binding protein
MFDSFDATNQVFTVVKNENYWDAENTILDKIIYLQIEDKQAAISELAAGNIDIMDAQYVPGLNELNGVDGIVETIVGDPSHQEISLNHNHPIFGTGTGIPDDGSNQVTTVDTQQARLVRQAMSHIVNRNYFVNEVMEGLASPAQTAMPSASQGFDSSIVPDPFNITRAKELMEMAGFDFSDLGTPDADGVYSQEFFNVTVLAPNTNPARNTWSAAFKDELGKIGIGLSTDGYVNVGWDQIIPRTFGYENATDVPLYPDGGFDVFFVGYSWGLDWDPSGLYTASGLCATGSCDNYYNYRNSTVEAAIADYTNELNPTARTTKVQYLQELLAEDLPVLSILYPQSHWAWGSNVAGIDALLISTSAQPWNEVSGGRATVVSSVTSTATQTNTETSTATATETNTEQVTVTAEGPIEILPILLGISSVFVTVYFRRRR